LFTTGGLFQKLPIQFVRAQPVERFEEAGSRYSKFWFLKAKDSKTKPKAI
jgi:hypothetical protein